MKRDTTVVLRFRSPAAGERKVTVEARDKADGALLFADTLEGTAQWLAEMDYRYVAGSSAIWTRLPPPVAAAE